MGENTNFTGKFDIWTDCRGTGAQFLVYALLPKGGGYTSLIQVTAKDEAALEETSRVVDTIAIAPENL